MGLQQKQIKLTNQKQNQNHTKQVGVGQKIRKRDRIRGRQLELGQDLFLDVRICPCVFDQILR
jgi:hypothetical protein